MKKTYFVRCMNTNGALSYSVLDNKNVLFRCDRYSELISFLKDRLSYFNKLGMLLIVSAPKYLTCLEEDVYSYSY